ncbi:MAG: hypothetical protein CM1200mP2_25260 [Planctomycetaceae bacterium]|nr:MAG: hypothetical protein CM1200mP2_25260 [Planctomycetaceae bacterium]
MVVLKSSDKLEILAKNEWASRSSARRQSRGRMIVRTRGHLTAWV